MSNGSSFKTTVLPVILALSILLFLIVAIVGLFHRNKYAPSNERMDLAEYYNVTDANQPALIFNELLMEKESARQINGHLYVSLAFLQKNLNSRFYWDSAEKLLLYTTPDACITVSADSTSYWIGDTEKTCSYQIVDTVNGSSSGGSSSSSGGGTKSSSNAESVFVALDFIQEYTNVRIASFQTPERVFLRTHAKEETAIVKEDTQVRRLGSIKSPILTDVVIGESVIVVEKETKWTKVSTPSGVTGFLPTSMLTDFEPKAYEQKTEEFSHMKKEGRIRMAWHQVFSQEENKELPALLENADCINVLSPTWFTLKDNEGTITDLGSLEYVEECHKRGIDVWALVGNLEKTDADSNYILSHTSIRKKLIGELMDAADRYQLDGINIDFEALDEAKTGDGFIQFIRELSVSCRRKQLVLSVDNHVPYPYTAFYNRGEQAVFADYIIMMGYDEHYAGSKEEGSVASLEWVSKGVSNTLKEVPADQLILAAPFYTRIWVLTPSADGVYSLSSTACSMKEASRLAQTNKVTFEWQEDCAQNYAQFMIDKNVYKIWMEDKVSLAEKLKLVSKNKLAGSAFWKLGLESQDVWDIIEKY